jgi:hypothetical protein
MEVLRIAEAMRRGALLKPQHLGPGLADPGRDPLVRDAGRD